MAIGDAVADILGTGQTNRQPSSGVEEQLTAVIKPEENDNAEYFDGSVAKKIFTSSVNTSTGSEGSARTNQRAFNMAVNINNGRYFRKESTNDKIGICGIQTAV